MMNVSHEIKMELAEVENIIEEVLTDNVPPMFRNVIINSPKYNNYLEKIEDMIIPFMDESTGEVDGAALQMALKSMMPNITEWVSVPARKFKMSEMISQIMEMLIGRGML